MFQFSFNEHLFYRTPPVAFSGFKVFFINFWDAIEWWHNFLDMWRVETLKRMFITLLYFETCFCSIILLIMQNRAQFSKFSRVPTFATWFMSTILALGTIFDHEKWWSMKVKVCRISVGLIKNFFYSNLN